MDGEERDLDFLRVAWIFCLVRCSSLWWILSHLWFQPTFNKNLYWKYGKHFFHSIFFRLWIQFFSLSSIRWLRHVLPLVATTKKCTRNHQVIFWNLLRQHRVRYNAMWTEQLNIDKIRMATRYATDFRSFASKQKTVRPNSVICWHFF